MAEQALSQPADNAGVRVVPPFIYVVVFGIGLILHWLLPISGIPVLPARIAALILFVAGVGLVVSSQVLFRRFHTSMVPVRPTTTLVVSGPYRLTRNPMYTGLLFVYLAAALWFGVLWALILTPLVVLAVRNLVIAKEERYLERAFGDTYRAYCTQVRRWI